MIHPCTVTEYSKGVAIGQKIHDTQELTALLYTYVDGYKQWEGIKPRPYREKPLRTVECKYCKTVFDTTRVDIEFCSNPDLPLGQRCYSKWHTANRRKPVLTKVCGFCHKEFQTTRSARVYCLDPCDHGSLSRVKPKEKRICVRCGKGFETKHPTQKSCNGKRGECE